MFNRIDGHATPMKPEVAEELVRQMRELADDGETFELRDYQGGRKIIECYFNGKYESTF